MNEARPMDLSYYAVYAMVFGAWFVAFVIIIYQIRTGKKIRKHDRRN